MIPEIALICLILSCVIAINQVWLGWYGAFKASVLPQIQQLSISQFVMVATSFGLLCYSFSRNDFSVHYIVTHSHIDLPLIYRISAVWGAHEGSMLLWLLILGLWILIASLSCGLQAPTRSLVIMVLNIIYLGMGTFILLTSNPFLRDFSLLNTPGQDLNPLLQDPGLIIHPPLLYMGYVGTALAFALAAAILIRGEYQRSDFAWLRQWTLLSWSCLTAGITLGSWWAYRVLGWGGWWFWDPVENASFLPWLACTSLLHAIAMVRTRDAFFMWTCFLAMSAFALSLLGTFLVRSGVLTSVHAFASDPTRGIYILVMFACLILATAALFIYRVNHWPKTNPESLWSKQFYLLTNSILLWSFCLAVLIGTLYPLFAEVLTGAKLSVGAPYFNIILIPFALLLLFLMPLVWLKGNKKIIMLSPICVVAALLMSRQPIMVFALALALWAFFITALAYRQTKQKRSAQPITASTVISHMGVLILATGVMLSSSLSLQKDTRMGVGDTAALGQYRFRIDSMKGVRGANYNAMRLNFSILKQGKVIATTQPEKRLYTAQNTLLSHPGIIPGFWRDFYVAIGEPIPPKEWTIRLYYKPFVRWIWFGGLMILTGGVLAFSRTRLQEQTA